MNSTIRTNWIESWLADSFFNNVSKYPVNLTIKFESHIIIDWFDFLTICTALNEPKRIWFVASHLGNVMLWCSGHQLLTTSSESGLLLSQLWVTSTTARLRYWTLSGIRPLSNLNLAVSLNTLEPSQVYRMPNLSWL